MKPSYTELSRIDRADALMQIAEVMAQRSTCSRAHVGVVIAREGRILVTGYNGAPKGLPHCNHELSGQTEGCRTAVHAEANAIAFAAREGIQLDPCEVYTTFTPCLACAQLLINVGVTRIYVKNKYRLAEGQALLEAAGIDIIYV